MEDRKSEIESLPTSFVACLAPIISYYRQRNSDSGVLTHFTGRVPQSRGVGCVWRRHRRCVST